MSSSLQLGVAVAAFIGSALGTAWFRTWALQRRIVDVPNARSSHAAITPRGAGAVIVLLSTALFAGLAHWDQVKVDLPLGIFVVGALLVGGVSWLDDVGSVPRRLRFAAHTVAGLIVVSSAAWQPLAVHVPVFGVVSLGWGTTPLLLLWIVGLINAYNFMDGIDGMAGLQGVVAGLSWLFIGSRFGLEGHATWGLLIAATCGGFLLHNVPKARVFMGDVGSACLGFLFSAMSVSAAFSSPRSPLLMSTALCLWPFVFDTVFTVLRRLGRGENIFEAHRSHLYQRLVGTGWSHVGVSSLYAALALMGAGCGWLLLFRSTLFDGVAMGSLVGMAFFLWSLVRHAEQSSAKGLP